MTRDMLNMLTFKLCKDKNIFLIMNGNIKGKRTQIRYNPYIQGTLNQMEKLVYNLTERRLNYCTTCTNKSIIRS